MQRGRDRIGKRKEWNGNGMGWGFGWVRSFKWRKKLTDKEKEYVEILFIYIAAINEERKGRLTDLTVFQVLPLLNGGMELNKVLRGWDIGAHMCRVM
ncbi:hypothetical protein M5689_002835 [Euphorbia peplus]|nr:hypothetical protein M5689_002835 [Euphorbia peplus]